MSAGPKSAVVVVGVLLSLLFLAGPAAAADPVFDKAFGVRALPTDVCTANCQAGSADHGAGAIGPGAVAVADGFVYVGDSGGAYAGAPARSRISVLTTDGTFVRAFGENVNTSANGVPSVCTTACQSGSNSGAAGAIGHPAGVHVVGDDVYVSDSHNGRVSVFSRAGEFRRAFGKDVNSSGVGNPDICSLSCRPGNTVGNPAEEQGDFYGYESAGSLNEPMGLEVVNGRVYVAERGNSRVSVFTTAGDFLFAFGGSVNNGDLTPGYPVPEAEADRCTRQTGCRSGNFQVAGHAMDVSVSGDEVFVGENAGSRIMVFTLEGAFLRTFGEGHLAYPRDIQVSGGQLYVNDLNNRRIVVYTPHGEIVRQFSGDFRFLYGLAVEAGHVYVSDLLNARLVVFDTAGGFLRMFGKNVAPSRTESFVCTASSGCAAGTPGSALGQSDQPSGAAVADGRVYVADKGNDRVNVYRTSGAVVGTIGSGHVSDPLGVAVADGQVYVTDSGNSRISVFATDGTFLSTFGNGSAVPAGIAVAAGEVYVTELDGHVVRVYSTSGNLLRTIGSAGSAGGQLRAPRSVAVRDGHVFVADATNRRISVFTTAGAFVRAFGKGVDTSSGGDVCTEGCQEGSSGSGAGALGEIAGIAVAGQEVYATDATNHRFAVYSAVTGSFLRAAGKNVNSGAGNADVCTSSCRAGDGSAVAGALSGPKGIAADGGRIYVAEEHNSRVSVFTAPRTELAANTIEFGRVEVDGGARDSAGTITNTGTEPVTLDGITTSMHADFERLSGADGDCRAAIVLAAGEACSVRVRFDPVEPELRTGTITVTSNAAPATIAVSGTGTVLKVAAVWPEAGAVDVAHDAYVYVAFDQAMDKPLTEQAFSMVPESGPAVTGVLTWSGNHLVFDPEGSLAQGTVYTIRVAGTARSESGSALAAFSSNFRTAPYPVVTGTKPLADATDIAHDRTASVFFSLPMDRASVESAFTLVSEHGDTVAGAFRWIENRMVFTPAASLSSGVLYTATVTRAARSATGEQISERLAWSYRISPAPVISYFTPTGDTRGVSRNGPIHVKFSEEMDRDAAQAAFSLAPEYGGEPATGTFSWSGSRMTFTPDRLDQSTLYRATVSTRAANPGGTSLPSDVTWTFETASGPVITSVVPADGSTAIAQDARIVVSFSQPMDRESAESLFTLRRASDGAAVAGAFSWSGNRMLFKPAASLDGDTAYVAEMLAGAPDAEYQTGLLDGREWTFRTSASPSVSAVSPAGGATEVARGRAVTVTFSQLMDKPTAQAAFTLRPSAGGRAVTGTFSWSGTRMTFTPSAAMTADTAYAATVEATAQNTTGHPLLAARAWEFRTALVPSISSVTPLAGATGVAHDGTLTVSFSEPMDKAVTQSAFRLVAAAGGDPLAGTFSWSGNRMIFKPSRRLDNDTTYTASVSTAAANPAGRAITSARQWDVRIANGPVVTSIKPARGATGIARDAAVVVSFSLPMNRDDTPYGVLLIAEGSYEWIPTHHTWLDDDTISLKPNSQLEADKSHSVHLDAYNLRSSDGLPFQQDVGEWQFRTSAAPFVTAVTPVADATGVNLSPTIHVKFSEAMDRAATQAAFALVPAGGGAAVPGSFSWVENRMRFRPSSPLTPGTRYTATVSGAAENAYGVQVQAPKTWSFTSSTS